MIEYRFGTVGFGYKEWLGNFYPPGMKSRDYLGHYSQFFDTVEIDSTFYGTPKIESVQRWAQQTPPDFVFCPKTPRVISHDQRLQNYPSMDEFLTVMRHLGEKLGPILIQLPPDFTTAEQGILADFLAQLPTDLRFAVEFRHRSWDEPGTGELLQKYGVCFAAADYIHLPATIQRTTDFLYIRFLGIHGRFRGKDSEQIDVMDRLHHWYSEIQPHLSHINTVYGFFNNDFSGHSPATCNRFKQLFDLPFAYPEIPTQTRLL